MASVRVTLTVEIDGQPLAAGTLTRRIEPILVTTFDYPKVDDGGPTTYTGLPTDPIVTATALLVRPSQPITLRLNGQTDAGIVINPDGLLLVLDGALAGGLPAALNNQSGQTATIQGFAAGLPT